MSYLFVQFIIWLFPLHVPCELFLCAVYDGRSSDVTSGANTYGHWILCTYTERDLTSLLFSSFFYFRSSSGIHQRAVAIVANAVIA